MVAVFVPRRRRRRRRRRLFDVIGHLKECSCKNLDSFLLRVSKIALCFLPPFGDFGTEVVD